MEFYSRIGRSNALYKEIMLLGFFYFQNFGNNWTRDTLLYHTVGDIFSVKVSDNIN